MKKIKGNNIKKYASKKEEKKNTEKRIINKCKALKLLQHNGFDEMAQKT